MAACRWSVLALPDHGPARAEQLTIMHGLGGPGLDGDVAHVHTGRVRTGGKALVWAGSAVVVVGLGALAAPVISDLTGSLAGSPAKPLATATAVADASRTRPSPTSSPTDGTTHLVGLGQGVSIPAGGPGDCTASSDINIMSTGGGPYHATLLGPDLVDTGPRQFAEGTAGRDREGRISTYTVASGDALFAIGDRFCIFDALTIGLLNHHPAGAAIQPGEVLVLRPDPDAVFTDPTLGDPSG